jgi:hypothetical protein
MTDPVIPPAAVEAAARAYWTNGGLDEDYSRLSPTARDALERATRLALEAALPHLRPLVEAQELRLATEVALKLGRQEALAATAGEMALSEPWQWTDTRFRYVDVQIDKESWRQIMAARDTGKGDSA